MKRQQRSREHSGLRRQSDLAQPSSLRESETNFEDRRQTLPAPSQARPVAVAEPREIPNSPQGSPHFVVQDDDFLTANDTGFSFDNDNSRIQIERSHSPPVVNRANQEAVHESTSTTGAPAAQTAALPSTEELWRAAKASISSQPHRGRNVRAAFIDRQENAHRISPISHEASARIAHRTQPEPGPSQKRQHHESADEEEVEETNGDFFQYDREVDIPRRRAEKPDQGRNKRQKTTQEAENQAISEVRRDLEETRRRATPAVPRIPPTTSSYKQQVRWTQSEDNRLIRLMGEYGTGWAKIERQNEAQPVRPGETRIEGRNQGQLKDRARNIKIKLLRLVLVKID
ncbi:hypothetical protein EYZ11_001277 [Aspergillus tanneri]|uniref:Myb-like domain-containing protein n=1 Tax=Aspergillus tanneri TaxID=1220188 RepID=A0A4S3JV35_9EURO|nr:hypothetical protein EYZ11_001277 [Aspergillus tanneri]